MKKTLELMFDYSSSGLWINGHMIDHKEIRVNAKLSKKIQKWNYNMDSLYTSILFHSSNSGNSKMISKIINNSNRLKLLIKEQLKIAKELKKQFSKKYKLQYFDEITNKRIKII